MVQGLLLWYYYYEPAVVKLDYYYLNVSCNWSCPLHVRIGPAQEEEFSFVLRLENHTPTGSLLLHTHTHTRPLPGWGGWDDASGEVTTAGIPRHMVPRTMENKWIRSHLIKYGSIDFQASEEEEVRAAVGAQDRSAFLGGRGPAQAALSCLVRGSRKKGNRAIFKRTAWTTGRWQHEWRRAGWELGARRPEVRMQTLLSKDALVSHLLQARTCYSCLYSLHRSPCIHPTYLYK